jgi:hypothetical protein
MDLTPQQQAFLSAYLNPKSPTWGNARQSALEAKYTQEYADNIMALMPNWLSENIGKSNLVQKAEKNLENALDGIMDDPEKGGKPIQWKATEMTLKTLKKNDYSERTELTGPEGKDLQINVINYGNNPTP